jgi:hypothetical protein
MWHDRKILTGDDWAGEMDGNLNLADIVTLLVSADFLNWDYCYDKETARAMERHAKEGTLVIPVIFRPCDWHEAPFGALQAIPQDGKAVSSWPNRDEAWRDVAQRFQDGCWPGDRTHARESADGKENAERAVRLSQQEQMERWRILQETQTDIFEIQQDVTANHAAAQSKPYGN